jgi:dienelactone hydrolase
MILRVVTVLLAVSAVAAEKKLAPPSEPPSRGDLMLADYFRNETSLLAGSCLADIRTLDDWKASRDEYRRQLQEMLGLLPWPERTDLKPVITGKLEQEDFTVEKLLFQALPHLYVTANLYLPKHATNPAPAILYVCGHGRVIINGVSHGSKAGGYQRHGEWFARNGYVCLTIDTLSMGEIMGIHRGTYSEKMWWWNSRGYTVAGVEAWFGIRGLDYLCSRPEVDKERIGMTGRSGGGSYSWTVAALDDRVKVVAPVAGITDLQNHVVDGCVESHCDCMFFVNTYRWDFPQVAALVAPRPLLIGNSDKDRHFPLDGVLRLHEKVRNIYRLYGETNHLGLLITEGPHEDTQELQLPVFRWFNKFLKGEEPLIEMAAKDFFTPEQLKVFDALPADQVNKTIQETFVPPGKPLAAEAVKQRRESLLAVLKEKSFGGWPAEDLPLEAKQAFSVVRDGLKFSAWDFTSQHDVRLRLYFLELVAAKSAQPVSLNVLDEAGWSSWLAAMRTGFESELAEELAGDDKNKPEANPTGLADWKRQLESGRKPLAFVAPRGVGLTAWTSDEKKRTQIRRRFMLLGQTLDGMRVWDIRRSVQAVHFVREADTAQVELRASGTMGVNALYAALFEPGVKRLDLTQLPKSHREGPDYLNVLKVVDIPQVLDLAAERAEVKVK